MRPQRKSFNQPHRPKKNLLISGSDSVIDAMERGVELEKILVLNTGNFDTVKKSAEIHGVPVSKVPAEKLKSFNLDDHHGCVAVKSKIRYQDLQDVILWIVEQGEVPLLLFLEGITDIRNIGAIARTAWCCGVHALVIPQKGVGTLNDDAILTSAGALEQITVSRVKSLEDAIDLCHLNGISIFASEMKAKVPIFEQDFNIPAAIILGSEDKGIQPSLYKKCDQIFNIPMKHNFESLNVSVATAMILYEAMKQRWNN